MRALLAALGLALVSGCVSFSDSGVYACDPGSPDARDCAGVSQACSALDAGFCLEFAGPSTDQFLAITGGASGVVAVGTGGMVAERNGDGSWQLSRHGSADLRRVFMTSSGDVWAVGDATLVQRLSGNWTAPAPLPAVALSVGGAGNLVSIGDVSGTASEFTNGAPSGSLIFPAAVGGVIAADGQSGSMLYLTEPVDSRGTPLDGGSTLYGANGEGIGYLGANTMLAFTAVGTGDSESPFVGFAVGTSGNAYEVFGGAAPTDAALELGSVDLLSVWADAESDAWVGARRGNVFSNFDTGDVEFFETLATGSTADTTGVWGGIPGDGEKAIFVTAGNVVLRFDLAQLAAPQ